MMARDRGRGLLSVTTTQAITLTTTSTCVSIGTKDNLSVPSKLPSSDTEYYPTTYASVAPFTRETWRVWLAATLC